MKLVVLAAGKGRRMGAGREPLAKTLVDTYGLCNFDRLVLNYRDLFDELVFVVSPFARGDFEMRKRLIDEARVRLVVDDAERRGTAISLKAANSAANGEIVVMNGDDIYAPADVEAMTRMKAGILLARPDAASYPDFRESPLATAVVTARGAEGGEFINTGCYRLPVGLVSNVRPVRDAATGEYSLPLSLLAHPIQASMEYRVTEDWLPVNTREDLARAAERYRPECYERRGR